MVESKWWYCCTCPGKHVLYHQLSKWRLKVGVRQKRTSLEVTSQERSLALQRREPSRNASKPHGSGKLCSWQRGRREGVAATSYMSSINWEYTGWRGGGLFKTNPTDTPAAAPPLAAAGLQNQHHAAVCSPLFQSVSSAPASAEGVAVYTRKKIPQLYLSRQQRERGQLITTRNF